MNSNKSRLLIWPLVVLFLSLATFSSYAQEEIPPWKKNLKCNGELREWQIYSGLEYCTGLNEQAHVIIVDLYDPGIRIEYVIAVGKDKYGVSGFCRDVNTIAVVTDEDNPRPGPGCSDPEVNNYYPVLSIFDAVKRDETVAVMINTDYGAGTQDEPGSRAHGPEGFTVVNGKRIDGGNVGDTDNNAENRPWVVIGQGTQLLIEIDQFPRGTDNGSKPDWIYEGDWIHTGIGGAPWLIKEGQIQEGQINGCTNADPHSCRSIVAQTAVGFSKDKRWLYLVVVEGRDAKGIADFMYQYLQPWDAIKWDGGGSSQLWYGGKPGDQPLDKIVFMGDMRRLSQYLAVFAQPGSGIQIQPGTSSPPDSSNWMQRFLAWTKIIWKSIGDLIKTVEQGSEWVHERVEDVERVIKWIDEIRNLSPEELAIRFLEWSIQQCLGSLSLIIGFITLSVFVNHRRRQG